jgi:hypothetical protein
MTSSTNGDGGDPGAGKTRRITKLSEQQKKDIGEMASPSQMPKAERKRQYSALRRAIVKSCEPALLAKFSLSSDAERLGVPKEEIIRHQN